MVETDNVMLVDETVEIDIQTMNDLGVKNTITEKEISQLRTKLDIVSKELKDSERTNTVKEVQWSHNTEKLRNEKISLEEKLAQVDITLKQERANNKDFVVEMEKMKLQYEGEMREL
jgi:multidrug resistance efflux pump